MAHQLYKTARVVVYVALFHCEFSHKKNPYSHIKVLIESLFFIPLLPPSGSSLQLLCYFVIIFGSEEKTWALQRCSAFFLTQGALTCRKKRTAYDLSSCVSVSEPVTSPQELTSDGSATVLPPMEQPGDASVFITDNIYNYKWHGKLHLKTND